jgi:hypothetical protein
MPRGGYQKPSNEKRTAVSNPRSGNRTDGMAGTKQAMREIPANGQYGARKEFSDSTAGAPAGLAGNSTPRPTMPPITPINAPTEFPGRPVTHGHSVGPGYTPEPVMQDRFAKINQYKDAFDTIAADAPEGFQLFWNAVKSQASGSQ